MRTRNSLLNIVSVIVLQITSLVIGMMSRALIVSNLPIEMLGVSGLFNSFFYSLGLIDIGFSTILIYNLYKPINDDNYNESLKTIAIFKKLYQIIGCVIFIIACLSIPFLSNIFKIQYSDFTTIIIVYLLQLITNVSKYFFLHKTCILNLYQKTYIINIITIICDCFFFVIKVLVITFTKSYILYVAVIMVYQLTLSISNVMITNHLYPYLKKQLKISYTDLFESGILKRGGQFLVRTIYDFVFYSTDNFLISSIIGTSIIGYLDNYATVINIFESLISNIIVSIRSSFANFMIKENNKDGLFNLHKIINIFNYFLVSVSVCGLYLLMDDFISLWLGEQFILGDGIKVIFIANLAIDLLFRPLENIYTIQGYIFRERLPLLLSAVMNFFCSLILIKEMGVIGVFIGTFFGKIIFWCGKIYHVTKDVFNEYKIKVIVEQLIYCILLVFETLLVSDIISSFEIVELNLSCFILEAILCVIIVLFFNILFFMPSKYFRQMLNIAKGLMIKRDC